MSTLSIRPNVGVSMEDRISVNVVKLKYSPISSPYKKTIDTIQNYLPIPLVQTLDYFVKSTANEELNNVSFQANPCELTGILGNEPKQRRALVELIGNRRTHGTFDGNIYFTGAGSKISPERASAFLPWGASQLYTPGLTYAEMVTYSARLRMNVHYLSHKERETLIKERVLQVLDMMELVWCKERVIPERPSTRGNIGGELRRLSVAVEFINLPSVFLLADPTQDLDLVMAIKLIECLIKFTEKGHTIIASFPKPANQIFMNLNKIVLLSQGCTIFAGNRDDVQSYFCSTPLVYALRKGVEYSDFLLDIAEGVERPVGSRRPLTTQYLQEQFEESMYFINPAVFQESNSISILPKTNSPYWNNSFSLRRDLFLFTTMASRALLVKFRETEVLKKSFGASTILGLFFGYFLWNSANFDYCLSLIGIPYDDVTNVASCLLLFITVLFGIQILNVHIIFQKLQVFRYERSARCSSTIGFWLTLLVTEIPFTLFFGAIFSNLSYWMSNMNHGFSNYIFYMGIHALISTIGLTSAVMFATIARKEIAVRDFFLFCLFMNVLTSGFLFTQPSMQNAVVTISQLNPFRWAYQGVMVWKFKELPDGERFLSTYSFDNFDKERTYPILLNFLIFDLVMIFLSILPFPNLLSREVVKPSIGQDVELDIEASSNSRNTDLVKPTVFSRESSVTGRTIINSQPSTTGADGTENQCGPTVFFHEISLRVADRRSPVGYRRVLHKITGRFDWGKLSVIMGAEGSGKTTLLHVLAGQHLGTSSTMAGTVYYNSKPIDLSILPWQRCAFIESIDQHFRDLTVRDVITYAMQLRCIDKSVIKSIKLNVTRTLELLQLNDVADKKTKMLTKGQLRRVTIAEELVHGPNLVLIDEPITGLDVKDAAVIMTGTLRELVNQERTVICTMHQPSAEVFALFDTLVLLSKGRLIYMGKADEATAFFINAPQLQFDIKEYANPADFLFDISSCMIYNKMGEYIDAPALENHYLDSNRHVSYAPPVDFSRSNPSKPPMSPLTAHATGRTRLLSEKSEYDEEYRKSSSFVGSIDVDEDEQDATICSKLHYLIFTIWMFFVEAFKITIKNIREIDIYMQYRIAILLVTRSYYVLIKRGKLMVGSTIVILYIACVFGIILGESTHEATSICAVFAMGSLLIILSNLQFVFFLYNNNEVFLREHSRGLYSTLIHWLFEDLPLLCLRTIHAFIFSVIVHEILVLANGQDGTRAGFFYLATWIMVLNSTFMVETIVYTLPDIRSAYSFIPGASVILFLFSGLIFKPSTLPSYLAPWLPSVSMIRWFSQGMFINQFLGDTEAFPEIKQPFYYSTYEALLNIFGWGGKTKWDCFRILMINFVIFRIGKLVVSILTVVSQRGKRGLKKQIVSERLY